MKKTPTGRAASIWSPYSLFRSRSMNVEGLAVAHHRASRFGPALRVHFADCDVIGRVGLLAAQDRGSRRAIERVSREDPPCGFPVRAHPDRGWDPVLRDARAGLSGLGHLPVCAPAVQAMNLTAESSEPQGPSGRVLRPH